MNDVKFTRAINNLYKLAGDYGEMAESIEMVSNAPISELYGLLNKDHHIEAKEIIEESGYTADELLAILEETVSSRFIFFSGLANELNQFIN